MRGLALITDRTCAIVTTQVVGVYRDYGFKFVYEVTLRQDRLKVEMRVCAHLTRRAG